MRYPVQDSHRRVSPFLETFFLFRKLNLLLLNLAGFRHFLLTRRYTLWTLVVRPSHRSWGNLRHGSCFRRSTDSFDAARNRLRSLHRSQRCHCRSRRSRSLPTLAQSRNRSSYTNSPPTIGFDCIVLRISMVIPGAHGCRRPHYATRRSIHTLPGETSSQTIDQDDSRSRSIT